MPDQPLPDRRLDAAWHGLRASGDIQFRLESPPPPTGLPHWLVAIFKAWDRAIDRVLAPLGRALHWLGTLLPSAPWARILFWCWLAAVVAAFGWMIFERLRHGHWRWPFRKGGSTGDDTTTVEENGELAAVAHVIHAWLAEADQLAGEGRYAEALHGLLLRCVEDLARRRPQLVRPAMTARDLARSAEIPDRARELFAHIAASVETSLFGGQAMALEDWQRGRAAYDEFVKAWRRRR